MKKFWQKKEPNLNIFFIYIFVIVVMDLIFYPLFPILLNYPPGSINTQFDIEFSKIPYYQQYIIINLLIISFGYLIFKIVFKGVDKWSNITRIIQANDINNLKKIRRKSFFIPHIVYILQVIIPLAFIGILFVILGFKNFSDLKFFLILTNGLLLASQISYLISKKYFREVLKYTYQDGFEVEASRFSLQAKIILQTLPLFLFSIIFTILIGRAGLVKEKGNLLFENYQYELNRIFENVVYIESEEQVKEFLSLITPYNKKDITFFINPVGQYKTSDNSRLSDFFLKYTRELAFEYHGHTYDYYGSDVQGSVIKLPGINGNWVLGVRYVTVSSETGILLIGIIVILIIIAVIILLFFGQSLVDDIKIITMGLNEIVKGSEADLNKKIALTSNDEIGDLVKAFNKVQDREKKYIKDIKEQQRIIVEQERLASLGQMIGGIIHNLKTPILSIDVAIRNLKDLVREYKASISDQRVTIEDHYEIAAEMNSYLAEMKPNCDYMSDVLKTVKGQITRVSLPSTVGFTLKELIKRVEIITNYELTKSGCEICYDIKADYNLKISGEISDLVQVLSNLISNSIQAYKGNGGKIELIVIEKKDFVEFQIKDFGIGIPKNIQSKLFKEIFTTKGKKGTGLGLYISSAITKGKFGGEIKFESIEGHGSVFYIIIPLDKKEAEEFIL